MNFWGYRLIWRTPYQHWFVGWGSYFEDWTTSKAMPMTSSSTQKTGTLSWKCWINLSIVFSRRFYYFAQKPVCLATNLSSFFDYLLGGKCIIVMKKILKKFAKPNITLRRKIEERWFFGLANYYHNRILSFAAITAPLSNLTRKGIPEHRRWNDPQEKAFVALRENLMQKQVLQLFGHTKYLFYARTLQTVDGCWLHLCKSTGKSIFPWHVASRN